MARQRPADEFGLWLLEQSHPLRRRARRIQFTAYGLAAFIAVGTGLGSIVAGVAVFDAVKSEDREVVATTTAEAHVRPRDLPGDRVRWAAPISWTDGAGTVHRGTVDVSFQVPAGARIPAGLAADGTLRQEPVPPAEAGLRGLLTATAVAAVGALVFRGVLPAGRRRAEAARVESWEGAWAGWNPRPRSQEH
ncbi:MAG: hypothetical protein ACT4QF_01440 [Sporichthyaceae bacterium]